MNPHFAVVQKSFSTKKVNNKTYKYKRGFVAVGGKDLLPYIGKRVQVTIKRLKGGNRQSLKNGFLFKRKRIFYRPPLLP